MSTRRWAAVIVCCLCVLTAPLAAAGEIALGFTGGSRPSSYTGYTLGWSFHVSGPIAVTHLGLYAPYAEGLHNSHQVGIWAEGGDLLVSGTVDSGTGEGWHWTSVTETQLGAGNYVIGALFVDGVYSDYAIDDVTTITTGSGITFLESRLQPSSDLTRPDGSAGWTESGFFGPNFQYGPAMVPEPALLQLPFLIAAGGAGLWWRSRKRRVHD